MFRKFLRNLSKAPMGFWFLVQSIIKRKSKIASFILKILEIKKKQ